MNNELRSLLRQAGVDLPDSSASHRRVLVVNNHGGVPRRPGLPAAFAQRGFKLLILDRTGRPMKFVRCGDIRDEDLHRETAILMQLQSIPGIRHVIPAVRTSADGQMRLQVNEFVRGPTYLDIVRRQSPRAWRRSVGEILAVARLVTNAAGDLVPWLRPGTQELDVGALIEVEMAALHRAGAAPENLSVLAGLRTSVPDMRPAIQHGDLWPGNVLRDAKTWRLIDFAEFGHVQVPLYDAFHLLSFPPTRGGPGLGWAGIGAESQEGEWTTSAREVLWAEAKAHELSAAQVGAALVYYLLHIAVYRLRPGVPREYVGAMLHSIDGITRFIAEGGVLEELVWRPD